jgi:hypothetical protein
MTFLSCWRLDPGPHTYYSHLPVVCYFPLINIYLPLILQKMSISHITMWRWSSGFSASVYFTNNCVWVLMEFGLLKIFYFYYHIIFVLGVHCDIDKSDYNIS